MKKLLLISLIFVACNKGDPLLSVKPPTKAIKEVVSLKSFTVNSRTYKFFGGDSIGIYDPGFTGLYKVYRSTQIDSVATFVNGEWISSNRDLRYNGDQIIGYTYYPGGISYELSYDNRGRVISINGRELSYSGNDVSFFQWEDAFIHYAYDDYRNPLLINNLFVLLVEDTFLWEFMFSEHNSVRREYLGDTVNYVNTYSGGLLVKKSFFDPNIGTYLFTFNY